MNQHKPKPIGVAVVGCGGFATGMHIPNLAALPAYRLHAVADVDEGRAQRVAAQYGLAYATADYTRLLRDPAVELVVITTPHNEHAAMAIAAARAGKHILLEKPMGMSAVETGAVVRAVREAGV